MKVLITGAYGQLGNEIKELSEKFGRWEFLFTDVDSLDIINTNEVRVYFEKNKPDFIVNCAAYTAVDKAEEDTVMAENVNAVAPGILAKAAKQIDARIIHISTDYVFDGKACEPYAESNAVDPQGVYGKTKLQGEQNCFAENPDSIVIRTSWLYSTFGNNFVKTMIRLGRERESLNVVFDQVGTPTYARDLAKTILEIIRISEEKPMLFQPGIYHFSNEGVASWFDFATAIFEITGIECKISPVLSTAFPTPAKRPNFSVLNKSKIRKNYNIEIPYWRNSLKECITKLGNQRI